MADERARYLRRNQTPAERQLWSALKGKSLCGYRFRRQHPMGVFIVDFICLERKLVIELDGESHATTQKSDIARDSWLKSRGYDVVRFWNHEVYHNLESVLEVIHEHLRTPPESLPPP